ncbi:MAG: hypothetical protein IKC40_06605 [Oscillospiraceae bacterium]|nr:hypothetical protein [Oscillospiraceae bacterium]
MRYITMEVQNNADGSASFPSGYKIFDDLNAAESEFHKILMYAAISTAPSKGCMLLTSTGELLRSEFYEHPQEAEEE